MKINKQKFHHLLIVFTFIFYCSILLQSSQYVNEEKHQFPVWKNIEYFEHINEWNDEVPEKYRQYLHIFGRLKNSSFSRIVYNNKKNATITKISSNDVIFFDTINAYGEEIIDYLLYSEEFGLYEIPFHLNMTIEGIPIQQLMKAEYIDVTGYRFDVKVGHYRHHIFCILYISKAVIPTTNSSVTIIERTPQCTQIFCTIPER